MRYRQFIDTQFSPQNRNHSGEKGLSLHAPEFQQLTIDSPHDRFELEARNQENQVGPISMAAPTASGARIRSGEQEATVHTGPDAVQMSEALGAQAFTHGEDIYFNQGKFQPHTPQGQRLISHEMTHVAQQKADNTPDIQRSIELRPPGPGEATAFDRAGELVDRLNAVSLGASYSLEADGRTLRYQILLPDFLSDFDFQLMDIIDQDAVIPLRLITSQGTVGGNPIVFDSFLHGYVDLEDLLASDDLSFQSTLLHFLAERAATNRYAQRIGTPSLDASTPAGNRAFRRGHRAGHEAQARHFRDVTGDSSIRFSTEFINPRGDGHIVFRSRRHGYQIFVSIDRAATSATGRRPRLTTGARTRVRHNGNFMSMEDFLALGIVPGSQNGFNLQPLRLGVGNPRLNLLGPQLRLDPDLQRQIQNLRQLGPMLHSPSLPQPQPTLPIPSPSLLPGPTTLGTPSLNPLALPMGVSGPNVNLIDWMVIQNELLSRGVFMDENLASSVVTVWQGNYTFFNQTLGFSNDQSVFFTNLTIARAVGAGLNGDFPTMQEASDRELNTSSLIVPVSDIIMFMVDEL